MHRYLHSTFKIRFLSKMFQSSDIFTIFSNISLKRLSLGNFFDFLKNLALNYCSTLNIDNNVFFSQSSQNRFEISQRLMWCTPHSFVPLFI